MTTKNHPTLLRYTPCIFRYDTAESRKSRSTAICAESTRSTAQVGFDIIPPRYWDNSNQYLTTQIYLMYKQLK